MPNDEAASYGRITDADLQRWNDDGRYPVRPLVAEVRRLAAEQASAQEQLSDAIEALGAVMVMWDRGDCPKKLDEALTWCENDEKARKMAEAVVSKYRSNHEQV